MFAKPSSLIPGSVHDRVTCCAASFLESLADKFWKLFVSEIIHHSKLFFFLNYFFLTEFHSSFLHRFIPFFFPIHEIVWGMAKKKNINTFTIHVFCHWEQYQGGRFWWICTWICLVRTTDFKLSTLWCNINLTKPSV